MHVIRNASIINKNTALKPLSQNQSLFPVPRKLIFSFPLKNYAIKPYTILD